MAVALAGSVALWVSNDAVPSSQLEDCLVVEDVARQWNEMSAAVINTLLHGRGQPSDYRSVADRQSEMAEELGRAADSVSSPELKEHLGEWAHNGAEYAALQRGVADRPPGTAVPPQSDAAFERVARSMTDAATALGEVCPNMPPAAQ